MSLRRIGDQHVFPIGLGAMPLSDPAMLGDRRRALTTIHAALDAGVTLIDTANIYAPDGDSVGHNEQLVAEGIRTWDGDGENPGVLVATKGGITRRGPEFGRDARPEALLAAAQASARRLGVDVIDLYYLHRLDPAVSLDAQLTGLGAVQQAGVARRIGLSNVTVAQLDRALELLGGPADREGIVAVQNEFSVRFREHPDVISRCEEHGIAYVPWSPLGGATSAHEPQSPYQSFNHIAQDRGVTVQQLTLAWLLALSPVIIPVVGSTRPATIEASVLAVDIELTEDEVATLSATAAENVSTFPDTMPPPSS